MLNTALILPLLFSAGEITPADGVESMEFGKGKTALVVGSDGLKFTATGPLKLLFDLYGDDATRGQQVSIVVTRDERYVSTNQVKFAKKKGTPDGYSTRGKLCFEVPEGEHQYLITAEGTVAVAVAGTGKLPRRFRAATEVETEPPPQPEVAEAPEPETATAEAPAEGAADPVDPGMGQAASVEEIKAIGDTVAPTDDTAAPAASAATNLIQAKRIAVYDLELQGIDPTIGTVATESLLAEIRKLQGVSAIGMDEIKDMLSHEANKQVLGCESDEACLAEIAGALGVDDLVSGKLSKVGDEHMMLVRRIDQGRAKVVGVSNQRLKAGSGQEFLLAIGPSVEELFPDRPLREGAERGVAKEVALRLDPPPLAPWTTYTVGALGVVAAAAGLVFGYQAYNDEQRFQELAGSQGVIEGALLTGIGNDAEANAFNANIAFGTGGGLLLTAGIMALFTDWWGYGETETE